MIVQRSIDRACWENAHQGRIDLLHDWTALSDLPPITLPHDLPARTKLLLTRENPFEYAKGSGYCINGDWIDFVCPRVRPKEKIYLAGEFNGWDKAIGKKEWELTQKQNENWMILTVKSDALHGKKFFKFVTDKHHWIEPHHSATNIGYENGARNYMIDPNRSGAHVLRFEIAGDVDWRKINHLIWKEGDTEENIPLWPGRGFYQLQSKSDQGATLEGNKTRFRIFAPRAQKVDVTYFEPGKNEKYASLSPEADGCWSALVSQNLEGYSYYYTVTGPAWSHTMFDDKQKILDPWALGVRDGLGVVVDRAKLEKTAPKKWSTPAMEDLIITEAHVRDLLAKAPIELTDAERKGFAGVTKLLDWPENPFSVSGINAVELQPLMEFDGDRAADAYHWGYMTTNFFAPASAYATDRANMTQFEELQKMVEAFHKKGIAVIVDVVFNHMGVPAGPLFIDKAYYFRMNADGGLTNWSGCGNDLRTESAMVERWLIDALEHWVTAFGVDGFRFDLAELLGKPFLAKAEDHLRKIKPDVIMIAEPWSFKGHIATALKDTDYASWNDGFREFVPAYLEGKSNANAAKYFIGGSVGGVAVRPSQTINYVESHDDHVWIDKITQNAGKNGFFPTLHDRRLTHLMMALMTMSLGVPMWAEGMETLRSKFGVSNTYLRGDLNALDYERVKQFPATVEYFRHLNLLRLSDIGRALRVHECAKDYLQFYEATPAIGVLYNSQHAQETPRLFFAINPSNETAKLSTPGLKADDWQQIADHERVNLHDAKGLPFGRFEWKNELLELPAVSCGIWVEI